jgi:hypothetical protein
VIAMKFLLASGADPNITASDKTTPLMAAAGVGWLPGLVYTRNENIVESLRLCLELGNPINGTNDGKPNSGGPSGLTALHGAAFKGLPEAVQFLVDHGANLWPKTAEILKAAHGLWAELHWSGRGCLLRRSAAAKRRENSGLTPKINGGPSRTQPKAVIAKLKGLSEERFLLLRQPPQRVLLAHRPSGKS